MNEFPIIDADSLVLRSLRLEDFDAFFDYVSDDVIKKQFNFNYDKDSCIKRLENLVTRYEEEKKPLVWCIALKETDEFVGIISIQSYSRVNKSFSLACGLSKNYRGCGYAYMAAYSLIDYVFKNFDMHRLELAHIVGNIASEKIFEKLGAKFEGIARDYKFYDGGFVDGKIYSILKEEWKN